MKWLWMLWIVGVAQVQAGSMYLCKSYGGGVFWSEAHCNTHRALVERIVSVPDSLPFEQRVKLAEQQREKPARQKSATRAVRLAQPTGTPTCHALRERRAQLEAQARKLQSGPKQDQLREDTRRMQRQQTQLRCG